jgi:hypothetical protein
MVRRRIFRRLLERNGVELQIFLLWFAVDNLCVAPVPEPAATATVGIALAPVLVLIECAAGLDAVERTLARALFLAR